MMVRISGSTTSTCGTIVVDKIHNSPSGCDVQSLTYTDKIILSEVWDLDKLSHTCSPPETRRSDPVEQSSPYHLSCPPP